MPGGDKTGPIGAGPLTGRGAGYCAGHNMPGYGNFNYWRGGGYRFGGGGRGWRHQYYATGLTGWQRIGYLPPTPKNELSGLKDTAEWLKNQLEAVTQRIEALEKGEL